MVGDGGGRSQPANTTVAGGVHMVVSVSGHLRTLVASQTGPAALIISMH
jgi:hypothetical protein